jgi:hypothetical protein
MNPVLLALHLAVVATAFLPVYAPMNLDLQPPSLLRFPWRPATWWHCIPAEEVLYFTLGRSYLRSAMAAGLPALLAFLNLPLLVWLKGDIGDRWNAISSLVLGLVSTSMLAQLLARYGDGRDWGSWVSWSLSFALSIAGAAALARLRKNPAPVSQRST